MILTEWIKKNKIKLKDLAELMGVSFSMAAKLSSGHRKCSLVNAIKIEKATKGQVTREEALWPDDFIEKNEDGSQQVSFVMKRNLEG